MNFKFVNLMLTLPDSATVTDAAAIEAKLTQVAAELNLGGTISFDTTTNLPSPTAAATPAPAPAFPSPSAPST
jgi:hypothetical protein